MYEGQQHEMVLERVHQSGAEEWHCPTCGRRFLMHWPPDYKKVVLEQGDENAIHTGGKSTMSDQPALEDPAAATGFIYEEGLEPYLEWMVKVDYSTLWDRDLQE